jgi:hypothetical protein
MTTMLTPGVSADVTIFSAISAPSSAAAALQAASQVRLTAIDRDFGRHRGAEAPPVPGHLGPTNGLFFLASARRSGDYCEPLRLPASYLPTP